MSKEEVTIYDRKTGVMEVLPEPDEDDEDEGTPLEQLADALDDALTDYRTWLADAVRRGGAVDCVEELRQLCTDIIEELSQ